MRIASIGVEPREAFRIRENPEPVMIRASSRHEEYTLRQIWSQTCEFARLYIRTGHLEKVRGELDRLVALGWPAGSERRNPVVPAGSVIHNASGKVRPRYLIDSDSKRQDPEWQFQAKCDYWKAEVEKLEIEFGNAGEVRREVMAADLLLSTGWAFLYKEALVRYNSLMEDSDTEEMGVREEGRNVKARHASRQQDEQDRIIIMACQKAESQIKDANLEGLRFTLNELVAGGWSAGAQETVVPCSGHAINFNLTSERKRTMMDDFQDCVQQKQEQQIELQFGIWSAKVKEFEEELKTANSEKRRDMAHDVWSGWAFDYTVALVKLHRYKGLWDPLQESEIKSEEDSEDDSE